MDGIIEGRGFFERIRKVAERMPLVLVKGGASDVGSRAAASHTGSLATNRRVFDGMCRQGRRRARGDHRGGLRGRCHVRDPTTSERVELAVVTTAGGWGVVTADAISGARAPGPSVHLHRGGGSGNE